MSKPVHPLPSASIMLVRDGAPRSDGKGRLETLIIERHGKIRFAGGAMVFPGGKVDRSDNDSFLFRGFHRLSYLTYRFAAIRELFEETGVLLARTRGSRTIIGRKRQITLGNRYRRRFLKDIFSLRQLSRSADLHYDPAQLQPFAHWITPDWQPIRFSTIFFLAPMPHGQVARHDGWEAVASEWVRPIDLLDRLEGNPRKLMFPTRMNLARLSAAHSVKEAVELSRRVKMIPVMPRVVRGSEGTKAYIPEEAGYGGTEFPF